MLSKFTEIHKTKSQTNKHLDYEVVESMTGLSGTLRRKVEITAQQNQARG